MFQRNVRLFWLKTRRISIMTTTPTTTTDPTLQLAGSLSTVSLTGQDKTQVNDAQILVSKGSGRVKVRKGQTEEEFQEQKRDFQETGPVLNTLTWLEENDLNDIDPTKKSDRLKLENLAQRLYYKREYSECLKVAELGLELFKDIPKKRIQNEWDELVYLQEKCSLRLI
ncbi:CYFA0S16e00518g1_1 [Cyberlindnera fabianii]|uniref:CYFA0S16e00518g1_1 n=1 Tax=Cyberlindnera fabianii TaxID=36022 RepID=A0A061BAP4_CYBFA|nr:CYFA0S16e00518g1_1 [Cyberlindnera fabianii]